MFREIDEASERYLRENGIISLVPADAKSPHETFANYEKHRIDYVSLYEHFVRDRIGQFYLLKNARNRTMGSIELTRSCEPEMKVLFFNMIVEKAVQEAKMAKVHDLTMISRQKFIVDAFLNNGFAVREVGKSVTNADSVFKGIKTFDQEMST